MSSAERAVLACVLYEPAAILQVRDALTPEMFAHPFHQRVFRAMLACADDRVSPDFIQVSDRMPEDISAVSELMLEQAYVTRLDEYLTRVQRESRSRAAITAATQFIQRVRTNPELDPAEALHGILAGLPIVDTKAGPRPLSDLVPDLRARFDAQLAGTWVERVVPTGLPTLDKALGGGFRPGELIILAARPGMGKSALALGLALRAAAHGAPVFYSLEMSMLALIERAVADMAGTPLEQVRRKRITPQQHTLFRAVLDRMAGLPLHIDDTSGLTTDQALARTQRLMAERDVPLVLADYLELMGDRNTKSEELRVSGISHRMKHLARLCGPPVVLLSQLSREVEKRNPPVPQMSDLRYSGAIEADADIVLMLYRHDYYVAQGKVPYDAAKENTCDVLIRKQRNGAQGTVTLNFDPQTMTFSDPTAAPWERMSA